MKRVYIALFVVLYISCSIVSACSDEQSIPRSAYDMRVAYIDGTLEVEERIEYHHVGNNTTTLPLMLYPNAYSSIDTVGGEEYGEGFVAGGMEISSLTLDGAEVEYSIGGYLDTVLTIPLVDALSLGDTVVVETTYVVTLPHANARLGVTDDGSINLSNFYISVPTCRDGEWAIDEYISIGDPYVSDVKDVCVEISVPKDYVVAQSPHCVERRVEEDRVVYDTTYLAVRDVAIFLSRDYLFTTIDRDGVTFAYYYYEDRDYLNTLYVARDSLLYFAEEYCDYPYERYVIVESPFLSSGMEYSGLSLINTRLSKADREETVVHETAHQWWYGIVGNDNVYAPWIDEGLAEYSALSYLGHVYGEDYIEDRVREYENAYMIFGDIKSSVYGEYDLSMDRSIYEYKGSLEYGYLAYVKCMLMHYNLDRLLGESYQTALSTLAREYGMGRVDREGIVEVFSRVTSRRLDTVFDAWLEGRVYILPTAQ